MTEQSRKRRAFFARRAKRDRFKSTPHGHSEYRCTVERVRGRRNGVDGGLFVVRTRDGRARACVIKGTVAGGVLLPHRVHLMADDLAIGAERARFWPTSSDVPVSAGLVDAVGDFARALRFASQISNVAALAAASPSSVESTHA